MDRSTSSNHQKFHNQRDNAKITKSNLESFAFKFSQFEKIYLPFFMGNDFITEICKILLTFEKRAFSAAGGN